MDASGRAARRGRVVKILSIDGGGLRGLIPARFIAEIERRCGRPAWQIFDVIAGTSTGALVTAFLTHPQTLSGQDVVDYYDGPESARFFQRGLAYKLISLDGLLRPKYPASTHIDALKSALGTTAELKDARTEIAIPMFDLRSRAPRTYTFTRAAARSDPDSNYPLWEVVRAASTASGYYPGWTLRSTSGARVHHPVDGGIYVNNPIVEALSHAIELVGGSTAVSESDVDFVAVSLGTGYYGEPIHTLHEARWGFLGWAPRLLDLMFEGQANAAHRHVASILPQTGLFRHYLRMQAILPRPHKLDDTSLAAREDLKRAADAAIERYDAALDTVCREL
jgi:predicted acylesterase/phospholipase RssA